MFDQKAIEALQEGKAILQAAGSLAIAMGNTTDGVTNAIAALPNHFTVHDLEKHMPHRRHARGAMSTEQIHSFTAYTRAHAEKGAAVFVDQDQMQAIAVLNLGTPDAPGHADNKAVMLCKRTAAFQAMQSITGGAAKQAAAAEFLEDWTEHIKCFSGNDTVANGVAVQSVRNLTIEAFRKLEATEEQLSSTTSAFESVKASSKTTLPTLIYFTCAPYHGFEQRTFVLRLGVLTGDSKPTITLRVIRMEEHTQQMAAELATKVSDAINPKGTDAAQLLPVMVGVYRASN